MVNWHRFMPTDIDRLVVSQADDDGAWEKPIYVRRAKPASLSLPSELAARATFFPCLHREASVEAWVRRIIQERLDLEEAAPGRSEARLDQGDRVQLPSEAATASAEGRAHVPSAICSSRMYWLM